MISFRTQFPLSVNTQMNDLINTGVNWIKKSPHSSLKSKIDSIGSCQSDFDLNSEQESFKLIQLEYNNTHRIGFKHNNRSDHQYEYTTLVVFSKNRDALWASIECHVDAKSATLSIPKAKKPHILKKILNDIPKGLDGNIEVDGHAKNLTDREIDFAADLLTGRVLFKMPVVYISATRNGKTTVNPSKLARNLFGMGHVIVEPNFEFSQRLRLSVNDNNAHAGAIGIYLPRGMGFRRLFRGNKEHDEFLNEIIDVIWDAQLSVRVDKYLNWSQLESDLLSKKIDSLKNESETNIECIIQEYEEKIRISNQLLDEAQNENDELRKQMNKLSYSTNLNECNNFGLSFGHELDMYDGEIIDGLLSIFKKELQCVKKNSRAHDILSSIIDSNKFIGKGLEIKDEMKKIFGSYDGNSSVNRKSIEKIGFQLMEEGKHLKLLFNGDPRYVASLSKTPSDHRSSKNFASDIIKQCIFSWSEKRSEV